MALYLIGDVQGCDEALARLLDEIAFSPSRDTLVQLGDMVNRGPQSLAVLRRMIALEGSAHCLLGNHDLHLLAVAFGGRTLHRGDTFAEVIDSPERDGWLEWLRACRMAVVEEGWLCVHAGVVPQWDRDETLARAAEVEAMLASATLPDFLHVMYADEPVRFMGAPAPAEEPMHFHERRPAAGRRP